jgi:transcriptional regulator GlxA family with amidase domain
VRGVTILLIDGGHSSTAVGPMEVFHSAGVLWNRFVGEPEAPLFRVSTASIDGKPVRADGGLRLMPDSAIADVGAADLIVMPSVGLELDRVIGHSAPMLAWLGERHAADAAIADVCSGVALLAEAGILEGKRATTHWAHAEDYGRRYPTVRWQPEYFVTEDDDVFCGGGVHAAIDLSLYLVEKLCGREVALQTAKALLVEMPRTWQAGFAILPMHARHRDERILGAEEWIHEHWTEEFRFEDLAARIGMSPRNFVRASSRRRARRRSVICKTSHRRRQAHA